MSVITAKTEFVFDAPIGLSHPMAARQTAPRGLAGRLKAVLSWAAEQPRRRAVISELEALTDHELADIGLSRATLHRVFDRDFAAGRAA